MSLWITSGSMAIGPKKQKRKLVKSRWDCRVAVMKLLYERVRKIFGTESLYAVDRTRENRVYKYIKTETKR
jgi:hypothetical protein